MSHTQNLFCPDCKNILNINKLQGQKGNMDDTPSGMSDSSTDNISILIEKLLNNESIEDMLDKIQPEVIVQSDKYKSLSKDKKETVKQRLNNAYNSVDENQLYYVCDTCNWRKKVEQKIMLLSRTNASNSQSLYFDINKYKNKSRSQVNYYTVNYHCPNKDCIGNKEHDKHEALIMRLNNGNRVIYVCTACETSFFM